MESSLSSGLSDKNFETEKKKKKRENKSQQKTFVPG